MYYMDSMGYFGGIGMILFWGAFIWLIVWLVNSNRKPVKEEPLEILNRRLANGEITKKQYEDMKKVFRE